MILFTLEKDQVSNAPLNALACTSTLYIHVHSAMYIICAVIMHVSVQVVPRLSV